MAKGKRTAVPGYPNIYRYEDGRLEAIARVAGLPPTPKRFGPATNLAHVQTWLETTVKDLRAELQRIRDQAREFGDDTPAERTRTAGTLEGDAPEFWRQIEGKTDFKARRSHTRAWFNVIVDGERLGSLPREVLTTRHANIAIAQWETMPSTHAIRKVRVGGYARGEETVGGYVRTAPATSGSVVAALTIRARCLALADLYHTLDGQKAPTPVDEAKVPARPKGRLPVTVPPAIAEAVLLKLVTLDAKTFGRFAVVTTTAQRPCQVARAQPDDVDLVGGIWLVRNAKNEPAHPITLNATHIAAWEAFIRANAWGWFNTSDYGKLVHKAGWPKGVRPYAARHSLAREAIRRGINLGDLQGLLGHSDPTTTRIYAPFVIERQHVVSDGMTDYLANVFKPHLVKK